MVTSHRVGELDAPLLHPRWSNGIRHELHAGPGDHHTPPSWNHSIGSYDIRFDGDGEELNPDSIKFPSFIQPPDEDDAVLGPHEERPSLTTVVSYRSILHTPEDPATELEPSTFGNTVLQLSKVILGSGMLVLPRVFQLLGVALALGLLAGVGLLTWFTVAGLAYASEVRQKYTYAAVVRCACGRPAKWALLMAIFINCLGMCVVFMVVFCDILVGSAPAYSGVLRTLFPALEPGSLFMDRRVVLAAVTVVLLLPICAQRDMAKLGPLALAGIGSVILFALTTVGLAGAALFHGNATPLPWEPDWQGLADGAGAMRGAAGDAYHKQDLHDSTSAGIFFGIASVVPLLLNADICHQSIFPAMHLLKPYTRKSFIAVTGIALLLCNSLYGLIAVCCLLCFGHDLDSNVLNNMSTVHMAPLIGDWPAYGLALLVRVTYFVSLLGSFVFTLHPLRVCVKEVLLGSNFATKRHDTAHAMFQPLTVALLVLCYVIAVAVPGIWLVLSMVGSTASTCMGFIFPAMVIFTMNIKPKWQHYVKRSIAVLVATIGLFLFGNGFAMQFVKANSGAGPQ